MPTTFITCLPAGRLIVVKSYT